MRTLFDKSVKGRTAVVPTMPKKHAEDMLPKACFGQNPQACQNFLNLMSFATSPEIPIRTFPLTETSTLSAPAP